MVRPERFELPTCCSGGNRSIQLSYGRALMVTVYMGEGSVFNANVTNVGGSAGIPSAAEAALYLLPLTDGLKPIPFKANTCRSV